MIGLETVSCLLQPGAYLGRQRCNQGCEHMSPIRRVILIVCLVICILIGVVFIAVPFVVRFRVGAERSVLEWIMPIATGTLIILGSLAILVNATTKRS
jgi:hypothetical protein